MKILLMFAFFAFSFFSVSCQRANEGDVIEREEEIDREDIVEDGIDQSDIHPGNTPSNVGNK